MMESAENKRQYRKGFITGLIISLIACAIVIGGLFAFVYRSTDILSPRSKSKIQYITSMIEQLYYEDVDINELQEGMYEGLVAGLGDKYSAYYSPEKASTFNMAITGEFSGLGATLTKASDGTDTVIQVYPNSAAEEIGVKIGDTIIAADDKIAAQMELSDFTQYTRGQEGTSFQLTYKSGDVEKTVTATRKKIEIPSVSHKMIDGDIGYIEISDFSMKTYDEYMAAINDLKSQGAKGVIFDLRFNGGGLVDSAVSIIDEILPAGKIVTLRQKHKDEVVYTSDDEKRLDMPIVMLVSGRTASAAEIFSAAIRDNHYGTIIGYKTYGKGVVQTSATLKDGSVVSITSGKYYTPNGEDINEKGIEPDIPLEFEYYGDTSGEYNEMQDNQVLKAIEVIRGNN